MTVPFLPTVSAAACRALLVPLLRSATCAPRPRPCCAMKPAAEAAHREALFTKAHGGAHL